MTSEMTLREKILLCEGESFWHTKANDTAGIDSIMLCDGPHGLRKQAAAADMLGINESVPATCFPTAAATGCSWDEELLTEIGTALGEEARAEGVTVLLGPGVNIKRDPTCGRNFEYFSEDPYLAGKLAAAHIRGVESTGTASSLKHFAANSQEYKRFSSDSVMDERTLREIYLTGFEIAVKEGRPSTVMCAYNKLNGVHCSDNKMLLTDILRSEWGFDGLVMTDWGAMSDRIAAFKAGCDLNMPGGSDYMLRETMEAVERGELLESDIDRSVGRVIALAKKKQVPVPCDMEAHYALARKAAAESAVLLKNDGILPISDKSGVVFFGKMAKNPQYQGAGSSHINPYRLISACDAAPDVKYAEDVSEARSAKICVVFAGLTDEYESEGFDRDNMKMPPEQVALIEAVAAENTNTVVVLSCGSAVECPWADKVRAILFVGLPGEAGGDAICDLLFGRANPCGKLAESWPLSYEDALTSGYYAHGKKDAHYREGVYVGYRYYMSAGVPVRWEFGYGLSFTSFEYSDLKVDGKTVSCTIKNTGSVAGKEIAELYIEPPRADFYRPTRELRDFRKVYLEPGEAKMISFELSDRAFALWNGGWQIPGGEYGILIAASSEDVRLRGTIIRPDSTSAAPKTPDWYFALKGKPTHADFEALLGRKVTEKPLKKGEFTMENTVAEMRDHSLMMKIMYSAVEGTVAKGFGGKKDYSNPDFRMMMASAADASMSAMKINGAMKNYVLDGMLAIANGHPLRGIRLMLKR